MISQIEFWQCMSKFGLECDLVHQQVDVLVDFETVQIVRVSLQAHQ